MRWIQAWCTVFITIILCFSVQAQAIPTSFNPSQIIDDEDFSVLPAYFVGRTRASSIALIQRFLEESGSALAIPGNNKSQHPNDIGKDFSKMYLDVPVDWTNGNGSPWVSTRPWLNQYVGRTVDFSEAIYMLTQEELTYSRYYSVDITTKTNPTYLIALLQKESGMSYGFCSNTVIPEDDARDCNGQSLNFRHNRITGYGCFDGQPDCSGAFRGAFRQSYFGLRDKKAWSEGCKVGFDIWNNSTAQANLRSFVPFKVGNTVTIDGTPIALNNAITCAKYIYTPHNTYIGFYSIIKYVDSRLSALAPTVPLDLGGSLPPPPPVVTPPPPPPAPVENFVGVQNKEAINKDIINADTVPKPPPTPAYEPKYIEPQSPEPRISDTLNTYVAGLLDNPRSVSTPPPQVAGVQAQKQPWWQTPYTVYGAGFIIMQSVVLGAYWIYKRFNH